MKKIDKLIEIAKEAGNIIMLHYYRDNMEVNYKHDLSPVSEADLESNKFICNQLNKLYPEIPIISEEGDNQSIDHSKFWLVDPLDGTKSFISRSGEFTVNIALIHNQVPIIGVIYSPLTKELYYAAGNISYKQFDKNSPTIIKARYIPKEGATIVVSSSAINEHKLNLYLQDKKIDKIISASSSLKICKIAEGVADLYPRFGQTMEWDTAAGHAILNAAGGTISDLDGNILSYGNDHKQYYNPEFIAFGRGYK